MVKHLSSTPLLPVMIGVQPNRCSKSTSIDLAWFRKRDLFKKKTVVFIVVLSVSHADRIDDPPPPPPPRLFPAPGLFPTKTSSRFCLSPRTAKHPRPGGICALPERFLLSSAALPPGWGRWRTLFHRCIDEGCWRDGSRAGKTIHKSIVVGTVLGAWPTPMEEPSLPLLIGSKISWSFARLSLSDNQLVVWNLWLGRAWRREFSWKEDSSRYCDCIGCPGTPVSLKPIPCVRHLANWWTGSTTNKQSRGICPCPWIASSWHRRREERWHLNPLSIRNPPNGGREENGSWIDWSGSAETRFGYCDWPWERSGKRPHSYLKLNYQIVTSKAKDTSFPEFSATCVSIM